MQVKMYMENCGKSPRRTKDWWVYVLTYQGKQYYSVHEGRKIEETRNGRDLECLLAGLKRCGKCDITVYTDSWYLSGGFQRLQQYRENGWKNSKGEEISHAELWKAIAYASEGKNIVFEHTERHTFTNWVQEKVKKMTTDHWSVGVGEE